MSFDSSFSGHPVNRLNTEDAPDFVTADVDRILDKLKGFFEDETGRILSPSQSEMYLLETAAYMFAIRANEDQRGFENGFVAWALQSLEGKDAGVKLGLSLLGADVTITQWYQMQPKGAANTHRINCMIEDSIWPVEEGPFGPCQIGAMWRMINRTKRFSQDTELRIGVSAKGKAFMSVYLGTSIRATAPAIIPPPPIATLPATRALVPTALLAATARALP
jgi:hypothetical protein